MSQQASLTLDRYNNGVLREETKGDPIDPEQNENGSSTAFQTRTKPIEGVKIAIDCT